MKRKSGVGILELLGVACILSLSIGPLFHLMKLTRMAEQKSEMEFMATLVAHHVMERIVALSQKNPEKLPPMSSEKPVIMQPEQNEPESDYFSFTDGKYKTLSSEDSPELFSALSPFKCQVDTYFLEDSLYKIIVYVIFEENQIKKRIYLERLLVLKNTTGNSSSQQFEEPVTGESSIDEPEN
ncbi:MAG: hypothetical protein HQM10_01170 [Candidatus Riflebacteria bacterium]|nr:hypothetical protein [Candidatus Riflebacteria bacterium]